MKGERVGRSSGALFVAAGIFLSRIAGLLRERVFAHYFGNSAAADAFRAAVKIPNFLQNLFGEGVLSASFIPVYSRLLAQDDSVGGRQLAGTVASLLALAVSLLSLLGVWLSPLLIDLIAPGFEGETRQLTIELVRILFPGLALLVMSAWCLGILNSHRRFFLPYAAPVLWNLAIIGALIIYGDVLDKNSLSEKAAWGLVLGSFLQFVIQLPAAVKLLGGLRFKVNLHAAPIRQVLSSFSTVVVARGVVQISAYIDTVLASLLPTGAVAALAYAQTLYLLPVSLFGMSVTAASLPEMSRSQGELQSSQEERTFRLREQLTRGLHNINFFVVPSLVAIILLGDEIVAAIFQTGEFDASDVHYVWITLIGYAFGMLAVTQGRLYASSFYALQDTSTPLKTALIRVLLAAGLGWWAGVFLPTQLGFEAAWGTLGLTAASSLAGMVEFFLLRRRLESLVGSVRLGLRSLGKVWLVSALAAGCALGVRIFVDWRLMEVTWARSQHHLLRAALVLSVFGAVYLGMSHILRIRSASSRNQN